MGLRGKIWILGLILLLGLAPAAMGAQKAFLWDGTHWAQVSFDGKAGYIFGIGNLADFETAASQDKSSPCISRAFSAELKNKTVDQIIAAVDKFYKENPDKMKTSVIEVVLQRCTTVCPPQTKSGGKK
ncbi:MAG: hypothetical protein PHX53_13295 [Syntrophales bacterium]|nr:hypothetical protein [Syntrophales bacterium]